jgi:hypothetical protein
MNRTPHDHAVHRGLYVAADPRTPQNGAFYKRAHAVADALHGWTKDAYHYQAPGDVFTLSDDDYELALLCAAEYPNTPRHEGAVPARS